MRGSTVDKQGRYGSYQVGDRRTSGGMARGGYRMRPSSERTEGPREAVEVRLGRLQVGVWIGLASLAISGSYVLGFFSGRHVGFEVARDTSATDLAKLSVPRAPNDLAVKNSAQIYEKLNAPAILQESVADAASRGPLDGSTAKSKVVDADVAGDDDIFRDITSGGELIIGDAPSMKGVLDKPISAKNANEAVIDTKLKPVKKNSVDGTRTNPKNAAVGSKFADVLPKGFYAQVAAPKRLQDAETLANRLEKSGFPVAVEVATVGGKNFYRVLVGPERTRLYADRLLSQLHTEKYIPTDPFIREVK